RLSGATTAARREKAPRWAPAPPGEDEALEPGQRGVRGVAPRLEPAARPFRDAQAAVPRRKRNREIGPEVEEFVLDAVETARPAHERVELVDVAHRGDPRIELRDARAVAEARLPLVSAARVDPCQADGLVALAHAP